MQLQRITSGSTMQSQRITSTMRSRTRVQCNHNALRVQYNAICRNDLCPVQGLLNEYDRTIQLQEGVQCSYTALRVQCNYEREFNATTSGSTQYDYERECNAITTHYEYNAITSGSTMQLQAGVHNTITRGSAPRTARLAVSAKQHCSRQIPSSMKAVH
jgi:hypothetical protein